MAFFLPDAKPLPESMLQYCQLDNWTNFIDDKTHFLQGNAFENVCCKIYYISFRPKCFMLQRRYTLVWTVKVDLVEKVRTNTWEIPIWHQIITIYRPTMWSHMITSWCGNYFALQSLYEENPQAILVQLQCSPIMTQKLHYSIALPALWDGNPLVSSGFPSQRAGKAGCISMSWHCHVIK